MTCKCGDTNCPSCGPAQGYDPAEELVLEWMAELARIDGDEEQAGCDKLVRTLGQFPRIAVLLEEVARHMARMNSPLMQDDVNRINERLDRRCWHYSTVLQARRAAREGR